MRFAYIAYVYAFKVTWMNKSHYINSHVVIHEQQHVWNKLSHDVDEGSRNMRYCLLIYFNGSGSWTKLANLVIFSFRWTIEGVN